LICNYTFAAANDAQVVTYNTKIDRRKCQLFYDSHFLRTLSSTEEFTWVEGDGSVHGVTGSNCQLHPVKQNLFALNTKKVDDFGYLEVYWGAYAQLKPDSSFTELNIMTDISKTKYKGSKSQNYQPWVGLQPPLDLSAPPSSGTTFIYDEKYKWGNLALASSVQNGVLHKGYVVYNTPVSGYYDNIWNINNNITNENIIYSLADKFTPTNKKQIMMRIKHFPKDDILPSRWEIETKTTDSSQTMVFSENAFKTAFKNPDFCANKAFCFMPLALLEHEINLPNNVPLSTFDDIFPRGEVKMMLNQSSTMKSSDKVKWSFPEAMEAIGALFGDKIILTMPDFKKYLEDNKNMEKDKYAKIKKIYCFFKNTKSTQNGNVFTWQYPDKKDLNCTL